MAGVDASARARVVGVDSTFRDLRGAGARLLPQRVALVGQGATAVTYALTPVQVTGHAFVGQTFGFGSPLHLAALAMLPNNGDGLGTIPLTLYPVADGGTAASGQITPSGTQVATASYRAIIGGIRSAPFIILAGGAADAALATAIADAINATLEMPVIATTTVAVVELDAKWKGSSTNAEEIGITIEGVLDGITFGFTPMVGGASNPSIAAALASIPPGTWETIIVNCNEYNDLTTLGELKTWGDGRWLALSKSPVFALTGTRATTVANAVVSDARKTDHINGFATSYGCPNLACQIAARAAARVAVVANNNPPVEYSRQKLNGILEPGPDAAQEDYTALNLSVLLGSSTSVVRDGVAVISDLLHFYHPDGEEPPAFRHVVDTVKLANVIYNVRVIFEAAEWDGAPLIPDDQPTTNPAARRPKDAIAAVNSMLDGLGLEAIISDPATAKLQTTAVIDSGNPKRLNVGIVVQLAGNTNIISIPVDFGFFFGTKEIIE